MSLLKRLFGGGSSEAPASETIEYKEFRITPAPKKDGGRYRVGALIRKSIDGAEREHHLIRADTLESHDAAIDVSINKAKQVIDEQGDGIFG